MSGKKTIEGIVLDLKDNKDVQFIVSFVANFGRADHTPDEAAKACQRLSGQGFTIEGISKMVGKSPAWVNIHLRLTKLDEELVPLLRAKAMPVLVAHELTKVAVEHQRDVLEAIRAQPGGLTIRNTRRVVNEVITKEGKRNPHVRVRKAKPSDTQGLLQSVLRNTADRIYDISTRDLEGAFAGAKPIVLERVVDTLDDVMRRLSALKSRLPKPPQSISED